MNLSHRLEYTYLKASKDGELSDTEIFRKLGAMMVESYENKILAVVMRQRYLRMAERFRIEHSINTKLVTVVSFPLGVNALEYKKMEVDKSLQENVDEIDIVINYREYIAGNEEVFEKEIRTFTPLILSEKKVVKWIIETAALMESQIINICTFINNYVTETFDKKLWKNVFIKTSTGYFSTPEGVPNGATKRAVELIKRSAPELPIKASGGIRTRKQAEEFIALGVERIGTSAAMEILFGSGVMN